MNKDTLQTIYASSFDQNAPIWQKTIDWESCFELEELFLWLDLEFQHPNDLDKLQLLAKAFITDIIALKQSNPKCEDIFDFIQFKISVSVLNEVVGLKIFNYAYDWLCNSISPVITQKVEIERIYKPYLLLSLTESKDEFVKKYFNETFLKWTAGLFYYSRSTGGLLELCLTYLEIYYNYLENLLKSPVNFEGLIFPLTQIATWSNKHKKGIYYKSSCELLYILYHFPLALESKKTIALYFSGCKNTYNIKSRNEWCKIIKNHYLPYLAPHEHIQLFTNQYENDHYKIEQNLGKLYEAIDIYHCYINSVDTDKILNYELSRIYTVFSNLITTLITNNKLNIVNDLIAYYFQIDKNCTIKDHILYIIPNLYSGVGYFSDHWQILTDTNSLINIPKIIRASNEFLSTTNTLDDDLNFTYDKPYRLGAPIPEKANLYFNVLNQHFQIDRLRYSPKLDLLNGMQFIYGTIFPIQAIISAKINIVIPYLQSFQKPEEARKIRNVLIWEGETLLSQTECIALKDIFTKKNINYVSLDYFSSSKEDFLQNYRDNQYDLIWICCHGEFEHMETHKSYLDLGNEIYLTLDELQDQKLEIENRRLFVIDACDGATTSLINSPAALGIGSSVVNSKQSLVSHQWPIDNYSALVSGILLAYNLSNDLTYSSALNETVQMLLKGKDEILIILDNYISEEVKERIERAPIDYESFYSWGSLAYHI